MNVFCEIAWGIIKDNSGFILKKRGELHQDDFSNVEIQVSAAADNKGFMDTTK